MIQDVQVQLSCWKHIHRILNTNAQLALMTEMLTADTVLIACCFCFFRLTYQYRRGPVHSRPHGSSPSHLRSPLLRSSTRIDRLYQFTEEVLITWTQWAPDSVQRKSLWTSMAVGEWISDQRMEVRLRKLHTLTVTGQYQLRRPLPHQLMSQWQLLCRLLHVDRLSSRTSFRPLRGLYQPSSLKVGFKWSCFLITLHVQTIHCSFTENNINTNWEKYT